MLRATSDDLTGTLKDWQDASRTTKGQVIEVVYDQLRKIAHGVLANERADHTLQATAVAHEAYLQLVEQRGLEFRSRVQFFGFAARVMRRVLVDHARYRQRQKRGGDQRRVSLEEAALALPGRSAEVVALDDALRDLATLDPQKAVIVELRFFGGLTIEETAEYLSISPTTVVRQWRRAKAWLFDQLDRDDR